MNLEQEIIKIPQPLIKTLGKIKFQKKKKDAKVDLKLLSEDFKNLVEKLSKLTHFLNPVEIYTIDNLQKTKETFFKKIKIDKNFNPRFIYKQSITNFNTGLKKTGISFKRLEKELRKFKKKLNNLKYDNEFTGTLKIILCEKIEDDLNTLLLVRGLKQHDDKLISKALKRKYGTIDNQLCRVAKIIQTEKRYGIKAQMTTKGILPVEIANKLDPADLLQNNLKKLKKIRRSDPELGKCYFNAKEIKVAFQWILRQYYSYYKTQTNKELPRALKYKVDISYKYSNIDVRDKSSNGRVIGIPATRIVSASYLLNLLAHEIESHVRQSWNGSLMFIIGGGELKTDNEILYEGLAKHLEDIINKKFFGYMVRMFPVYYIFAIKSAQQGKNFSQVFWQIRGMYLKTANAKSKKLKIREQEADKIAWGAAYRVFRGHIDTSNKEKYAMTKDQAYLQGWIIQKQLEIIGLDHLNEAGIFQPKDLHLLAKLNFSKKDLPFPFLNKTEEYLKKVMMPERFGYKWSDKNKKFIKITSKKLK